MYTAPNSLVIVVPFHWLGASTDEAVKQKAIELKSVSSIPHRQQRQWSRSMKKHGRMDGIREGGAGDVEAELETICVIYSFIQTVIKWQLKWNYVNLSSLLVSFKHTHQHHHHHHPLSIRLPQSVRGLSVRLRFSAVTTPNNNTIWF